jgi:hypothetical protein
MKGSPSIVIALLAAVGLTVPARSTHAQAVPIVPSTVTLKTFTPIDSVFVNPSPTTTKFVITLKHTVSGTPTEYRVSRYIDFRDAGWIPYIAQPTLVVPTSWFPSGTGGTQQITLYLQVRAKNPMGGRPGSLVNGQVTVQPDFFFSEVLGRRIRVIFAG